MSAKGTIILTGANGGIGSAIVSRIRSSPELSSYHAIYTVRDASSVPQDPDPRQQSNSDTQNHETISLELTNLTSVRTVAAGINARVAAGEIPPIRALILNAGYNELNTQKFTDDGFATMFMANYLGHWLLVLLLVQSMDRDMGRIVVIGSKAHDPSLSQNARPFKDEKWRTMLHESTDPIAYGTWSSFKEDQSYASGMRRYGASKLCAIMMIGELQRRLSTDPALSNVSILGVDPGTVPTNLARHSPFFIRVILFQLLLPILAAIKHWRNPTGNNDIRTPEKSAGDILAAALDCNPVLGERPQGMYLDGSEVAEISPEARDESKRLMVWRDSVRYTGLKGEETMLVNWE
ncbi:short-chain dehydrogenase, putative [Talaromyces stipitatus ATCC 10500]|uniref:Short-chain dehydrogenase, putative n=1 Tax=Talaromyces stipitatus (strain ATCC 10500 / CBS 375.48 / QM 6759 / NRRL 1006) TaxID=441959 RepID=B8LYV1_TALSN|nr:short-chain dehydrogenase, putative [Talaromyces stipitatus ATCC 10500]EED23459.1 short-chain dehydrogenase, putative [Talaromyces stipitatus ATCC 10500]